MVSNDHVSRDATLHEGLATSSCKKGSTSDAHVEVDLAGRPNRLVRVARVNGPSGTRSCLRRPDRSNCRTARHKASQAGMLHGERSWATPGTMVVRVVTGRCATPSPGLAGIPRSWPKFAQPRTTLSAFLGERNLGQRPFLAEFRPDPGRSSASRQVSRHSLTLFHIRGSPATQRE